LSLLATLDNFPRALITSGSIGAACATLSVIVVLRRWAFIGEGIAHSGIGGIGTGWLVSLAVPAMAAPGPVYAVAVAFCLVVALAIGRVTFDRDARGHSFGADSAIGIFMVASLAWGYLALTLYNRHGHQVDAGMVEDYLFGTMERVSREMMFAALAVSAGAIVCVAALFKEILYYAFDPLMAHVSGVRTGFIHYALMLLLAMVIAVAMRLAGNLLVTALLVLPGATALSLSRRLGRVMTISVVTSVIACLAGPMINRHFLRSFPSGPAIVLVLFVEFLLAYAASRLLARRKPE
jgi:manganese/iron transport system permease protein